jgi:hypothetical protein
MIREYQKMELTPKSIVCGGATCNDEMPVQNLNWQREEE